MVTRRRFISTLSAAVLGAATPLTLSSCAGGLTSYRGRAVGGQLEIPKTVANQALQKHGAMFVRADNLPVAIVLRQLEDGTVVALSTVCTHSGCEVRVMPHSFQCPCHGSEYAEDGEVIEGPAAQPLQQFELTETEQAYFIKVKI